MDDVRAVMEAVGSERAVLCGGPLGIMAACMDVVVPYLHERKQFGQALAQFQNVQFKLADMATELIAARQMVRWAASKLDSGARDATSYCAMAKRFATDAGFQICNEALQLHGGYAYLADYGIEKIVRDLRVHQILEGTNEIMRMIVARQMVGK